VLTFSRFLPYYVGDMKILNTLLQNGLTVRDGIVLIKLCSSDTFTPSLLVDEYFQKANITRIINKLRDKGLVAKESETSHPNHSRRKEVDQWIRNIQ